MPTLRPQFVELLREGLKKVYFKSFNMEPKRYPAVFNVVSSNKAFEDVIDVAGLGSLATKPEGTPISYKDPVQGTRRRVVHSTFALGFRVTMEMMEDDLYGIIRRMPSDLGEATRDHQEVLAWSLFNDAFAGNTFTGLDGLALCSASHTSIHSEGSTQSNLAAPGVALSTTGLEDAVTSMRTILSPEGRFTPVTPSTLLVHPSEDHNAARLLESEFDPGSSDNAINTMRSSRTGIQPLSVPYLTDQDAWFLLAKKSQTSITWYNRKSVTFDNGTDSQTKDRLYDAIYRASVAFYEWRGVYASQP